MGDYVIKTEKRKGLVGKMEDHLDSQLEQLDEKTQVWVYKIKNFIFDGYNNWVKPILIAVFMFFLFANVKTLLGYQETMFIQMTVIIIYLRIISSKMR